MRALIYILLLFGISQLGYSQSCDNNLITNNPGFETGTLSGWEDASGQVEITTDSYNGNFAMVAHTQGDKSEFVNPSVNFVNPSKTCVLSACAKIIGNPVNAGFGVIYGTFSGQVLRVDSIPITNTSYECFSLTIDPPTGTAGYLISGSINGGEGSILLDDFCLECFDDCIVGESCDDGDPTTSGDFINQFCECRGSACGVFPEAGDDVSITLGQSTVLTASGGVSYEWDTGQTSSVISVEPTETKTYRVTVSDGASCFEVDSVTVNVLRLYDVGNFVWIDENGDGCQDPGEEGLNGVRVEIYDRNDFRYTGKNTANRNGEPGYFNFNILEGEYRFKVIVPSGYVISPKNVCGDNAIDSDFHPITGFSDFFTLDENIPIIDVGLVLDAGLPVELSHFQVTNSGNKNDLLWNVITEVDLDAYVVERKFGTESNFEPIAEVKAVDNDTYESIDYDLPKSGTYYYRLLMRDKSGHLDISEVRSVNVDLGERDFIHAYPNPANDDITIILNTTDIALVHEVSLFNTTGQRVHYAKHRLTSNYLKQTIDLSNVPEGIYTVHVKADDTSFVKKIVKVD